MGGKPVQQNQYTEQQMYQLPDYGQINKLLVGDSPSVTTWRTEMAKNYIVPKILCILHIHMYIARCNYDLPVVYWT